MSYCPVDEKPCIDDLCYGGGCARTPYGDAMLEPCDGCGVLWPEDDLFNGYCEECISDDGDDAWA